VPNLFIILLIAVVLIRSQLRPKPLTRSLFTIPVLLLIYAVYAGAQAHVQTGEAVSLLLAAGMGGIVGMVQGRLARVYEQHQTWWVAGSWLTLGVWLLSMPIRFLIKYGFIEWFRIHIELTGSSAFVPYLFSIGGILLGKVLMLTLRYPDLMLAAANGEMRRRRSGRVRI
jgi:hypothetical protein